MSNSHFDEIRRGGNALFSIFRVRPVRLDLENVLLVDTIWQCTIFVLLFQTTLELFLISVSHWTKPNDHISVLTVV